MISRQILLAGAKFDGISVNLTRNFKKSYKGHIEDTKGHYNSPKIKGEKDERFCSNSRNYGYRSRALGLSNGSGGFVLTENKNVKIKNLRTSISAISRPSSKSNFSHSLRIKKLS